MTPNPFVACIRMRMTVLFGQLCMYLSARAGGLTARYQVRKSIGGGGFAGEIEEHRSTRLVIRRIVEVSLLEGPCFVRCVPCTIWEMVDL
jgi:hypothetical protein